MNFAPARRVCIGPAGANKSITRSAGPRPIGPAAQWGRRAPVIREPVAIIIWRARSNNGPARLVNGLAPRQRPGAGGATGSGGRAPRRIGRGAGRRLPARANGRHTMAGRWLAPIGLIACDGQPARMAIRARRPKAIAGRPCCCCASASGARWQSQQQQRHPHPQQQQVPICMPAGLLKPRRGPVRRRPGVNAPGRRAIDKSGAGKTAHCC